MMYDTIMNNKFSGEVCIVRRSNASGGGAYITNPLVKGLDYEETTSGQVKLLTPIDQFQLRQAVKFNGWDWSPVGYL